MKTAEKIQTLLSGRDWIPSSREATPEELFHLHDLYNELFFGQELMDEQAILQLISQKLLHIFIVLKTHVRGAEEPKMCGFFAGNFLSQAGLANVMAGRKDGRNFEVSDLVSSIEDATAIYIGAIGGRTLRDRGFIMAELIERSRTVPNVKILSRPTTPEGKRIAAKYGWAPLVGPDGQELEVWEGQRTLAA